MNEQENSAELVNRTDVKPPFYYRDARTVFKLSFWSLNFYLIYWFYKQFKTVREANGKGINPILGTIFQIITSFSLFGRIEDAAADAKLAKPFKGALTAMLYAVLALSANVLNRFEPKDGWQLLLYIIAVFAFCAASSFVIYKVQTVINDVIAKRSMPTDNVSTTGERVFTIIGAIFFGLIVLSAFFGLFATLLGVSLE